jgi:hypothetical protein
MKLRNKKTSEVYDVLISAYGISGDVAVSVMDGNAKSGYADLGRYKTLAELNEEWEDYEPAGPLIKDEKIRKAVRAWAEANDYPKTMELYYNAPNFVLRSDISTIEFDKEIEPLQHGEEHTITELCGEEKE